MLGKFFLQKWPLVAVLIMLHGLGYGQTLSCPELNIPSDGATEVPVNTDLEWSTVAGATGYLINVGITPGGDEILDQGNVPNSVSLNLSNDLPPLSAIYVSIFPYDDNGIKEDCSELRFTTAGPEGLPGCATFVAPGHAATGVSLNPSLGWNPAIDAEGYLLTVGTTSTGSVILDRFDVGNITSYTIPILQENTTYYVAIVPYNSMGEATGCGVQSSFTTDGPGSDQNVSCTMITNPVNGATNVSRLTTILWLPQSNALGYLLTMGTTSGGNDILNNFDVGNMTSHLPSVSLPDGAVIYATIFPYTLEGASERCPEVSFTIEKGAMPLNDIVIPRFFTPNGDGINDDWRINPPQNISILKILVFDRFGLLLKQMEPFQSWDGTFNGRLLPSGSYWYSVKLADAPQIRGYFALKR